MHAKCGHGTPKSLQQKLRYFPPARSVDFTPRVRRESKLKTFRPTVGDSSDAHIEAGKAIGGLVGFPKTQIERGHNVSLHEHLLKIHVDHCFLRTSARTSVRSTGRATRLTASYPSCTCVHRWHVEFSGTSTSCAQYINLSTYVFVSANTRGRLLSFRSTKERSQISLLNHHTN